MKLKMMFFVLLVAAIALNALPAYATDFSGYVKTTALVDWTWRDGVGTYAKWLIVYPRSGRMTRDITQYYIKNIADFTFTDAIYLIAVAEVEYTDQAGVVHTITDPTEIAQLVRLDNSEEMWQGNYVIWLGTIQPGKSKRLMFNWWIGETLTSAQTWGMEFEYLTMQGVWYLP